MSQNEQGSKHYTTGEIVLSMAIVVAIMVVPVVAGAIYYFYWL